ncbi:hypothetical protein [Neomesorhizobium albiziae]|uniref:hypothetical protein n=1 Tax=Neomesorhizobium albiziae TaxID=335020 RepID=UPI00165FBA16|nr:hypothetical protein [Mesorhizobium albiziae]
MFQNWQRTQRVALVLCRLQQRLERRVINAVGLGRQDRDDPRSQAQMVLQTARWDVIDEEVGYSVAREAEVAAVTAALKLQDQLLDTPAQSLVGIVAKLEIIARTDREIGDPTDFPWPHIESVLRDLKKFVGNPPNDRPDRSAVRADAARYWAIAADLVRLEKAVTELPVIVDFREELTLGWSEPFRLDRREQEN